MLTLIDIALLSQSLPGFISFLTSGQDFYSNDDLGKLVVSILRHFEKIVEININQDSLSEHYILHDWTMLGNK